MIKADPRAIEHDGHPNGWITVWVCFVTLALAYGTSWYAFSVFLVALTCEFNWSRSLIAGAFSVFMLLHGIVGPFAGNMVGRYGAKAVFLSGALVLAAGFALSSFVRSSGHFYLSFGVITAMGVGLIGWVPNTTVVQQWFRKKRGLPIGIISSGVGIGIFVCVPLIQKLIDQVGWRATYRIMAVCIPLIIIAMVVTFSKRPMSWQEDHSASETERPFPVYRYAMEERAQRSWTLRRAAATRPFWLIGSSFFLASFTTHSVLTHQVAYFIEHGLQASSAAYIAGMIGVVSIGAKIFWGILSDRWGRAVTYTVGTVCSVLGILFLIGFGSQAFRHAPCWYALFFGLGYAAGAALPPLIVADLFQGKAYGGIFGTLMIMNNVGGASGSWFAGLMYDHVHSYLPAFMVMIACSLCASLNIWWAARSSCRAA